MKAYVLGFAFLHDADGVRVVLVRKRDTAPVNAGLLNGLGGSIEPVDLENCGSNQSPERVAQEAMCREFEEECGARTVPYDWRHFGTFWWSGPAPGRVSLLAAHFGGDKASEIRTTTDEEIVILPLVGKPLRLPDGEAAAHNLNYLLCMALDPLLSAVSIQYQ